MDLLNGRLLSVSLPATGERLEGTVLECAGARVRVACGCELPVGAAVVIETSDSLLLGEVSACGGGVSGFDAVIQLDQGILQTAEVARLARALIGEKAAPGAPDGCGPALGPVPVRCRRPVHEARPSAAS